MRNYQSVAVSGRDNLSKRRNKDGTKKRRGKRVETDTRLVCEIHDCHFVLTGITNFKDKNGIITDYPVTECPQCIIENERARRKDKWRVRWIKNLLTPNHYEDMVINDGTFVFDEGSEEITIEEDILPPIVPAPVEDNPLIDLADDEFEKMLEDMEEFL